MRTMFVAQENQGKKMYQKPNILRKRSKAEPKSKSSGTRNSLDVKPLVTAAAAPCKETLQENVKKKYKPKETNKVEPKISFNNSMREGSSNELNLNKAHFDEDISLTEGTSGTINDDVSQNTINVEAFLNSDMRSQVELLDLEDEFSSRLKQDWCLDFINNAQEIIIEDIDGSQLGSLRVAPSTVTASASPLAAWQTEQNTDQPAPPVQNLTLEYLANSTMNFKCDAPGCKKRFGSEPKLNKHKLVHNKSPQVRQTTIECPVKKIVDEIEQPCGVFCASKEELVKHLNESHDPEDAMYICTECGRRFFWASGLRAHTRAHWSRGAALTCSWAGCGRVFRQPCRLREHMRAHTGDKPYPCRYPNCGWSFRTASKLLRHARRHTGERRHACADCGAAFRRREHLRDHGARAHSSDDHKFLCTYVGCQKSFTNVESLKSHMKKVHSQKMIITAAEPALTTETLVTSISEIQPDENLMVSLETPSFDTEEPVTSTLVADAPATVTALTTVTATALTPSALTSVGALTSTSALTSTGALPDAGEWHAARTHCTWPLEARPHEHFIDSSNSEYVLEEDVQVELSESESNTYTIRSDLFLHGNILNNEDSEQMRLSEGGLLVVPPTDTGLSLLDAHPTIDLMQEELMYTDAAVDESTFRVFLLNGEELA